MRPLKVVAAVLATLLGLYAGALNMEVVNTVFPFNMFI